MAVTMNPTDSLPAITGTCRALLSWRVSSAASPYLAVGTEECLVVVTGGVGNDITPAGLTPGNPDTVTSVGPYGSGNYGGGDYGTGDATQGSETDASIWSLDLFGDYLVGVLAPSDGILYYWDTAADAMTPVPNAPTNNTAVVMTQERFLVALGAGGDPRKVQWADQETLDTWTPADDNQAGGFPLATAGRLVCGARGRNETLLWTTEDVFSMQYVGGVLVYAFQQLGSRCGIVGPNAKAVVDGRVVWMGHKNFFVYDGYVRPAPSEVSDHVFADFNRTQRVKCFATTIADAGEVWFFYPSATADEPDRYVVWNYREDHWTPGQLARTAGIDRGVLPYPVMAAVVPVSESSTTTLYEHEKGFDHDGADPPSLTSGPIELGGGDAVLDITELVPDEATRAGQVLGSLQIRLVSALHPTGTTRAYGPFTLANPTTFRATGRQVQLTVEEVVAGDWRLGTLRLNVQPGGRR
jgi:hypothetical protein